MFNIILFYTSKREASKDNIQLFNTLKYEILTWLFTCKDKLY